MRLNEAAVFRWVVIVGLAAAAVILVTLVVRPLAGALLGLALVVAGAVHAYRWVQARRRGSGS
jgi:hypothetical protein